MGNAGQQRQQWWHRQDVRYWYALGVAFLLAGVFQISLSVGRPSESGYVMVGIVYVAIAAGWFAVGGYKHRRVSGPRDRVRSPR